MSIQSNFKSKNNIEKIIAISGGSDDNGSFVESQVEEFVNEFKDQNVAILSGGTSWGIPKIASMIAKEYGLVTIGVLPSRGKKYQLPDAVLDHAFVIEPRYGESQFGDESEIFAKLTDGIGIFSGSMGTLIEFSHIMKMNEALIKYDQKHKPIAPLHGVGGVSELIYSIPNPQLEDCIPKQKTTSGSEMAKYLITALK